MSEFVNPPRSYDSTRRLQQARQTRLAVLDAARRHFLDDGFSKTTIAAVASDAGVSVETVYKAFGNKAGLVKAVVDVSIVGDDEPVPMLQRAFVQRTTAEPDPRKKLLGYGVHVAEVGLRSGPIQLVVRNAAAADDAAAELWSRLEAERLTGMTVFARHLRDDGHLRKGVAVEEARDVLWVHNSVELWDLLVNRRNWTNKRFGRWVGQQLIASLL